MNSRRRFVLFFSTVLPLGAHAACSATNGEAIPSVVYDASALDVGSNPDEPDASVVRVDGSIVKDSSTTDAPTDSPADAPVVSAPVQINELFVDNATYGDGVEYVELRAAPGTPADDLKLRVVRADGLVKEVTAGEPGAKFDPAGLFTIGGGATFNLKVQEKVDHVLTVSQWGLDNTRGAVQVLRGTTLLDVVGYATDPDAGAATQPMSAPKATVEGSPAQVPAAANGVGAKGISFGRKTAAADTNNNAADFCRMEASPGYPQKPCL